MITFKNIFLPFLILFVFQSDAQEVIIAIPADTSNQIRSSSLNDTIQVHSARDLYLNPANRDFKALQESVEFYFSTRDRGKGSGYKQWKRWEDHMKDRLNPEGQIINYSKHIEQLAPKRNKAKRSLSGDWKNIGPRALELGTNAYAPGLGRINCIAFHPSDANVIYIGAPAGGLWKTIDAGESWTALAQDLAQLGISGIAVNYNNASEIYILTGDGDGGHTNSTGVHRSINGGATWSNTTLPWGATDVVRGYKLAMHPTDPSTLLAATTQGLYKTINGGLSWIRTYTNVVEDFEFKPGDPTTMYLVSGADWRISSNTGDTWPLGNTMSGATRMALAVTPNNASVVYLVAGPGRNDGTPTTPDYRFRGLYYSTNSALNFSFMSNSPNILGGHMEGLDSKDQSWFDLALVASHTNANSILVGAIDLWGSSNNGSNWTNRAHWNIGQPPDTSLPYVHADIHALDINPVDNKLYCGSDGGIFVSSDFGVTWKNLSRGISVSQFYRIEGVESNPDHIMMGAQDNGIVVWKGEVDTVKNIWGGDGMTCKINPNNENTIYYTVGNGILFRSITGGDGLTNIRPGNSQSVWVTPFDMDPNNSEILFAAFRDTIWRTTNASTTTTTSWTPYLPGGVNLDWFRFVHVSRASSNVYVCSDKKIYKSPSTVTTTSWTDITANLPVNIGGVNITSITSSHFDPNRIWVCLSGL
ncbi:MAG: hypothetical protein OEQ53_10165, partial [Saprospiraceae bacterium]|nr:hypothetical protein [Saprospiraceae bacterium]